MAQGTISRFNEHKGYGFVAPDHGGGDVFAHYSDIEGGGFRSLEEGEKVSYEVPQDRKGSQAQNVSKLQKAASLAWHGIELCRSVGRQDG